jgi:alkyl hydroperoxide reductase subunit AhpC
VPCTRGSLPELARLYEKYASLRSKFEILAVHDARATSMEDMDQKLKEKEIVEKHWDGKQLPFPILLDSTGETEKKYGIVTHPTTLLIDPDGKLVHAGHHEVAGVLEEKLKSILADSGERR